MEWLLVIKQVRKASQGKRFWNYEIGWERAICIAKMFKYVQTYFSLPYLQKCFNCWDAYKLDVN